MYRLLQIINVKKYRWPPQPPDDKRKNAQHVVKKLAVTSRLKCNKLSDCHTTHYPSTSGSLFLTLTSYISVYLVNYLQYIFSFLQVVVIMTGFVFCTHNAE